MFASFLGGGRSLVSFPRIIGIFETLKVITDFPKVLGFSAGFFETLKVLYGFSPRPWVIVGIHGLLKVVAVVFNFNVLITGIFEAPRPSLTSPRFSPSLPTPSEPSSMSSSSL